MSLDDNDGQMIFGDLEGLKLPDICLTGEEKPQKNLTQKTSSDRGSNPDPLRDRQACYHLLHSGGLNTFRHVYLRHLNKCSAIPSLSERKLRYLEVNNGNKNDSTIKEKSYLHY